jgi:hypothetical protein
MLLAMVVAQAVSASPPEQIDLTIRQPCQPQSSSPDEVVVCARTGESPYRLRQPPAPPPRAPPKAEVKLAEGVDAGVETEQADVGGHPSNRAMLRLKVKF